MGAKKEGMEDFGIKNMKEALKVFKAKADQLEKEFQECTSEIKELRKKQTRIKHKFSFVSRVAALLGSGKEDKARSVISSYNRRASYYTKVD